jgi:predicted DNA binding protein
MAASTLDDRLTDRQRETLRLAFHAGYFDWPRNADAETVAAEMGIAQSTLSQHLRTAERKLLDALFP